MTRLRIKASREDRKTIFRDVMIFQLKLLLDGAKDIILSPVAILAAIADVISPTDRVGKRFYHVLQIGEKFDRWLSLYAASEKAEAGEGGLFGASRAGSNTMLGQLESIVLGHDEPKEPAKTGDPWLDDYSVDEAELDMESESAPPSPAPDTPPQAQQPTDRDAGTA